MIKELETYWENQNIAALDAMCELGLVDQVNKFVVAKRQEYKAKLSEDPDFLKLDEVKQKVFAFMSDPLLGKPYDLKAYVHEGVLRESI